MKFIQIEKNTKGKRTKGVEATLIDKPGKPLSLLLRMSDDLIDFKKNSYALVSYSSDEIGVLKISFCNNKNGFKVTKRKDVSRRLIIAHSHLNFDSSFRFVEKYWTDKDDIFVKLTNVK